MAVFKFRAFNKEGRPIQAEIFVGGTQRGFTKKSSDDWLEVETQYEDEYEWYARYDGKTIDRGKSKGGKITACE
ncbi:MAG: hypothetical protein LBQ66_12615 [Planctomycetaceae bacterium]|jgi:hypothetical protein|nr:hypothetical protein [Planctomycetaceae bacterium]